MKKAVRYFSKLGNTKTIAEAIAEGAGVSAVSISDEPSLQERVDLPPVSVMSQGRLSLRRMVGCSCRQDRISLTGPAGSDMMKPQTRKPGGPARAPVLIRKA